MYSDKVKRLVSELPNSGRLTVFTNYSRVENPICGDVVSLYVVVDQGNIRDCRFLAQGCAAAIASAAAVTLVCTGKPVSESLRLQAEDIIRYLEGLPPHKRHGAELAIEALRKSLTAREGSGRSELND